MKARTARLWVWLLGLLWLGVLGGGAYYVTTRAAAQPAQRSYFTEEQAREGEIAYAQHCASCHGPDLQGVSAPALVGETFWARWGGATVAELYSYIQSQMPLGRGGSLEPEIYADATAYILQENGFPAGETALVPSAPRLTELPIDQAVTTNRGERETPPGDQVDAPGGASTGSQAGGTGDPEVQTGGQPSAPRGQTEGQGRPVARSQAQVGDLRLTVLPEAAQVEVGGPAEYRQSLPGGSRLLSLPPGSYTVTASFQGERLEQTVEIVGGEVAELDLTFNTQAAGPVGTPEQGGTESTSVENAPAESGDAIAGVTTDGGQLYARHCLMCHGENGGGGIGPALSSNPRLASDEWVIHRVAAGGQGMPAFGGIFAAQETAAVVSYVRTHFGNAYGEVTPQQVRRVTDAIPVTQLSRAVVNLEDAPLGQQRYAQVCSGCHGLQGGGDIGPPLAGNPALQNEQLVLTTILYGRGQMPAFSLYSDLEIAEIASYIRTEWSNGYSPIAAEQVQAYRPDPQTAETGGE